MSDTPIKSGKRPASESTQSRYNFGEFAMDNDMLTVPPYLKKEIESQGLEYRWIDRSTYIKNSGRHYRGWQPYKKLGTESDTLSLKDSLIGNSPEGYVQSGTAILAVRPKEWGIKHRAKLKEKADKMASSKLVQKQAAELRQSIRESGLSERVIEGYDENDK